MTRFLHCACPGSVRESVRRCLKLANALQVGLAGQDAGLLPIRINDIFLDNGRPVIKKAQILKRPKQVTVCIMKV